MKHFTLVRSYLPNKTVGVFIHEDFKLHSLELAWRNNAPNKSCIPEGTYIVKRDVTGRHRFYAIQDVPNRSNVEIHIANTISDLLGCIGLGMGISANYDLVSSRIACNNLIEYVGDESFTLTITHFNPVTMTAKTMQ